MAFGFPPTLITSSLDEEEGEGDSGSKPGLQSSSHSVGYQDLDPPEVVYESLYEPVGGSFEGGRFRRKSIAGVALKALSSINPPPPRRLDLSTDSSRHISPLVIGKSKEARTENLRKSSSKDTVHLTYFNNTYSTHAHHPTNKALISEDGNKEWKSKKSVTSLRNLFHEDEIDRSNKLLLKSPQNGELPVGSFEYNI